MSIDCLVHFGEPNLARRSRTWALHVYVAVVPWRTDVVDLLALVTNGTEHVKSVGCCVGGGVVDDDIDWTCPNPNLFQHNDSTITLYSLHICPLQFGCTRIRVTSWHWYISVIIWRKVVWIVPAVTSSDEIYHTSAQNIAWNCVDWEYLCDS